MKALVSKGFRGSSLRIMTLHGVQGVASSNLVVPTFKKDS